MNNPTKVYIAGPYGRAEEARKIEDYLYLKGFEVTSGWYFVEDCPVDFEAVKDLLELNEADVILVLDDPENKGCGTYWELGYAFASGKPCYVIDQPKPYRCIFYYLPGIVKVQSLEEFIVRVKALEEVVA